MYALTFEELNENPILRHNLQSYVRPSKKSNVDTQPSNEGLFQKKTFTNKTGDRKGT